MIKKIELPITCRYIYTGCAAGRVVIYDLLTGMIVKELAGHQGVVRYNQASGRCLLFLD